MSKRVADLVVETFEAGGARTCYEIVCDTLNWIAYAIRPKRDPSGSTCGTRSMARSRHPPKRCAHNHNDNTIYFIRFKTSQHLTLKTPLAAHSLK
jgi:hypothetical protein